MRHSLSPAFTGSKLRGMTELMVQIGLQYSRFMVNRADKEEAIDMKTVFRRYSLRIMSSAPQIFLILQNIKFYESMI